MKTIKSGTSQQSHLTFSVISLFPEMFNAVTDYGVVSRAIKQGIAQVNCINPRDFTEDKHRTVDDRPYGGGPGMLMKVEPLQKAIQFARKQFELGVETPKQNQTVKTVYLSPQGQPLNKQLVEALASAKHLILIAGRYEGIDERLLETEVDVEVSLGDFVLSGGEIAAMAVIDSVVRKLPGVLGHQDSAEQDSFEDGLLDHPHYTRPEVIDGRKVPPVLLGGNHQQIADWRLKQRLGRTWLRRPDLLKDRQLSDKELKLLAEFKAEQADD